MRETARAVPNAGFSLVETMFALLIVALIAALALPFVAPAGSMAGVKMQAVSVAALLRADRNFAISKGRTVEARVDTQSRRVVSGTSSASIRLPPTIRISSEAQRFRFFPDGSASGGTLTLSRGPVAVMVRLNPNTAAITLVSGSGG